MVNRISDPWVGFEVVDISATDHTFSHVTRAFSFGTAGTLHVLTADGTNETIPSGALAAGIEHPGRIVTVFDDSTAADIVGYW